MLSRQVISTFQRKSLQVAISLLLLAGWSVALAGSTVDTAPASRHPASTHATATRAPATRLNTALPVVASATLPGRTLPLDKPRPTRVGAADPSTASLNRSNPENVPSPGFDVRWRESRELVGPDLVSVIRNYRRDGLPVVHLYESGHNMLAIGVNPHGMPGIYFTSHVGG